MTLNSNQSTKSCKKPPWLRVKAPTSTTYQETNHLINLYGLNTVCQEAACPNIGECWSKKHCTIMILGSICTRACRFCNVKTGIPEKVDSKEPERVALALSKLNLSHVVITSVDRDDLADGGASQFVKVIQAIRETTPATTIEVLTPDFLRKDGAVEAIIKAKPDVYNHNLETVPRLYPTIRPGARYYQSLQLLDRVKKQDPEIFTKSGLMVGLGESKLEMSQVMDDLRTASVDFITIGQYLQPSPKHHEVLSFITPQEFESYATIARSKGFLMVSASPLTRSSYHAGEDFKKLRQVRLEKLKNAKI